MQRSRTVQFLSAVGLSLLLMPISVALAGEEPTFSDLRSQRQKTLEKFSKSKDAKERRELMKLLMQLSQQLMKFAEKAQAAKAQAKAAEELKKQNTAAQGAGGVPGGNQEADKDQIAALRKMLQDLLTRYFSAGSAADQAQVMGQIRLVHSRLQQLTGGR